MNALGEFLRVFTAIMAVVNLVLAMLLIEQGSLLLFLCLACAVVGWIGTRNRDAWHPQ